MPPADRAGRRKTRGGRCGNEERPGEVRAGPSRSIVSGVVADYWSLPAKARLSGAVLWYIAVSTGLSAAFTAEAITVRTQARSVWAAGGRGATPPA